LPTIEIENDEDEEQEDSTINEKIKIISPLAELLKEESIAESETKSPP
jgi:hypothetical protein